MRRQAIEQLLNMPISEMGPESFPSPNAIPPRRSSSINAWSVPSINERVVAKSALQPLPEASWMAHGRRPQTDSSFDSAGSSAPETFDGRASTAIHANDTTWSLEKEKIVCGPYEYMEQHPGKDIRKQLITSFNAWLMVPKQSLEIITKVVGMLHTASLLCVFKRCLQAL